MEIYHYNRGCGCTRCRARGIFWPVFMMTIGVLALLDQFDVRGFDFDHTWPLILIVIGLVLVFQRNASTEGHTQLLSAAPAAPPIPPASQPPSGEVRNV